MKPKIYGNCKAGCLWETVHKADFDRSASIVRMIPGDSGNYVLDAGKTYKVKSTITDGKYDALFSLQGGLIDYWFEYDEFDEYRDIITFELLSATLNDDSTLLTIVYEINGNRYTDTYEDSTGLDLSEMVLHVSSAQEVYMVNTEAEILADGVQLYDTAADSGGDECPDALTDLSLEYCFTVYTSTYDGQREPKAGDLLIWRFLVPNSKGQNQILCRITSGVDNQGGVYMQPICFLQGANGSGSHVVETFTVSSWTADATISPFAYKTEITATSQIGDNTILSLDIDTITATANGIAIGKVEGQVVSIYAVNAPAESITIKLLIQN